MWWNFDLKHLGDPVPRSYKGDFSPAAVTCMCLFYLIRFYYSNILLAWVVWHILISHVCHGYGEAGLILELVVCGLLNKEISTLWYRELL